MAGLRPNRWKRWAHNAGITVRSSLNERNLHSAKPKDKRGWPRENTASLWLIFHYLRLYKNFIKLDKFTFKIIVKEQYYYLNSWLICTLKEPDSTSLVYHQKVTVFFSFWDAAILQKPASGRHISTVEQINNWRIILTGLLQADRIPHVKIMANTVNLGSRLWSHLMLSSVSLRKI